MLTNSLFSLILCTYQTNKRKVVKLMAKIYKTMEEIQAAVDARDARLYREMLKGSTGSYGKRFESEQRLSYKLATGQNIYRDDFKAKDPNKVDMFVRVNGHKRRVELKTGRGALVYCDDQEQAWAMLEKLTRSTCLLVWDAYKDGNEPLCFILSDLLAKLAEYKGKGLQGWFEYIQPTDYRSGQIQFRPYNSKAKLKFLQEVAYEIGLDWQTIRETGEI